jgi:hypothetical protein
LKTPRGYKLVDDKVKTDDYQENSKILQTPTFLMAGKEFFLLFGPPVPSVWFGPVESFGAFFSLPSFGTDMAGSENQSSPVLPLTLPH